MIQQCLRALLWFAFGLSVASPAFALGEGGAFRVTVSLNAPQEPRRCVSEWLSDRTHAEVRVVCQTGQFVEIEPSRGKPFLGTHGSAYRFHLPFTVVGGALVANADPYLGAGTITALRVYNVNGGDGPLEMLVSF
jgi:hypothetical protein